MWPWPPLGKSENIYWRDTLLKMGFQTNIFCSKVSPKCRKCRFRDPNLKTSSGGHAPGPTYNCVITMVYVSWKCWLRHCQTRSHIKWSMFWHSHFIPIFYKNSMKSWMMKPKFALSHDFLSVHHEYFVGASNVWLRYWCIWLVSNSLMVSIYQFIY